MKIYNSGFAQWNVLPTSVLASVFKILLGLVVLGSVQICFGGMTYSSSSSDSQWNTHDGGVFDDSQYQNTSTKFDVSVTGALPSGSAYLYVHAYDIDSTLHESRDVYLNGVQLGKLEGTKDQWSITEFKVPVSAVYSGTNTVEIKGDQDDTYDQDNVDWCKLSIDQDFADYGKLNDILITSNEVVGDTVHIEAQTTAEIKETGHYIIEFKLVYPDNTRTNVVKNDFYPTAGEDVILSYSPTYPVDAPTGTYTIEAILFKVYKDKLYQQDSAKLTFENTKENGPVQTTIPPAILWQVTAEPLTVVADGASASVITVKAFDADGKEYCPVTLNVQLSTTLGTLSDVTIQEDCSYSATLTSKVVGTAIVQGKVNDLTITDTAQIQFVAMMADSETSTITASPLTITADGIAQSHITVELRDSNGNPLSGGGDDVELTTTLGNLSDVVDQGDGTYNATLTSTTVGMATISGELNNTAMTSVAEVNCVAEPQNGAVNNTLTAKPTQLVADGTSTSEISVQLLNNEGVPLENGGFEIQLTTSKGTLSEVVDNQDGTYSAIFTAPNKINAVSTVASIESTIDGQPAASITITLSLNPYGDEDDDGINNEDEGTGDNDGDGVPNYMDIDSDNDGILDVEEGSDDPDQDNIPNYLDNDSDGDGLTDLEEHSGLDLTGSDLDHDGLDDAFESDLDGGSDGSDRGLEGLPIPNADIDGDSTPNYLDTDSDNDGILDINEPLDYNGDGTPDYRQSPKGLETAPRGGGSFGSGLFVLLVGLLILRRYGGLFATVLAALGLSGVANANDCQKTAALFSYDSHCWYAGLGIGMTRLVPDENQGDWDVSDKNDGGYKGFIGYQLSSRWQVELDYSDLGKVGVTPKNAFLGQERDISYKVPAIWGLHQWPIKHSNWRVFAKAGISSIQNSADSDVNYEKVTSAQLALGVGAQRALDDKWIIRAELDSFDKDADYTGITLARYFGSSTPPKVVDSTPPIPTPKPAPKPPETINLNVRFKTASADVEEAYLAEIEKLAIFMRNHPDTEVSIEGHTDSVGSDSYNQKLSELRAASVRYVLINRFGIPVERLLSVGHGESQPIASNDDESGRVENRRVVAILPSQ